MKIILSVVLLLIAWNLHAQTDTLDHFDNTKVVQLDDVILRGKASSATQEQVEFYRTTTTATLEDILARLPELQMIRRGAYGMEPSIRSFSGGQINLLIDGMRIHGACTDKMDPATIYIEPINLHSIELKTGNSGTTYGSNIGGTINLKMAEPSFNNPEKLNATFLSGFQTVSNAFTESLMLNYSKTKWTTLINFTYRNADNYRNGDKQKTPYSNYEKINYAAAFHLKLPKNLLMKLDYIGDDAFFIGYPALPMDVGYASSRIGAVTLEKKNDRTIKYWQAKLYANYIKHFMDDTQRENVYMHMDMPGTSSTIGFIANTELEINKKNNIVFTADASNTKLYASMTMYPEDEPKMYMLTWPNNSRFQSGIGATWNIKPALQWALQFNGRFDFLQTKLLTEEAKNHVGIFSDRTDGTKNTGKNLSVTISKKMAKTWKITSSLGYAERLPSASEQYGFYLFNAQDAFDYIGNPTLKKEKAIVYDFSLQKSTRKLKLKLAVHASKINDYIIGKIDSNFSVMTHGANGVKQFQNNGNAWVLGGEGFVMYKPAEFLTILQTLRYTYGIDKLKQPLPLIAPLKWMSTVSIEKDKWNVRVEYELSAAQHRINIYTGEDKTPGYGLMHLRAAYRIKLLKSVIQLQSGIENIFNKSYHEHNDWNNILRPGRNLYLELKVSL